MAEPKQLEIVDDKQSAENFNDAEARLMKALTRLDKVVGGTVDNLHKLKKELNEKKSEEQPLLSNHEIKTLQEENKRLQKEKSDIKSQFEAEKVKNEKLAKLKNEVSERVEKLIGQLENVIN